MKKYVKPDVLFEGFEMSVGVAACTMIIFDRDGYVKSYDRSDAGILAMEDQGFFGTSCELVLTKDEYYNYYGSQEGEIFGS